MTLPDFAAADKEGLVRSLWRAHGRDVQVACVPPPPPPLPSHGAAGEIGNAHRPGGAFILPWVCGRGGQVLPLLVNLMADFEVRDATLWHGVLQRLQQASLFPALLEGLVRLAGLAPATTSGDAAPVGPSHVLSVAEGPGLWQAALEGVALSSVEAGASPRSQSPSLAGAHDA